MSYVDHVEPFAVTKQIVPNWRTLCFNGHTRECAITPYYVTAAQACKYRSDPVRRSAPSKLVLMVQIREIDLCDIVN